MNPGNLGSAGNLTSANENILTPRKPLSAFFWFTNDHRTNIMIQNPDFSDLDIGRQLGRMWINADAETKSKYEAVAEEDQLRYEKEMAEFKVKYPNYEQRVPIQIPSDNEDSEED
ncbi:high mobility group protein DSP1-like [Rhynchophorus ferrugineus]|uniref:high mobility group protein DSP1-like n=1 Tax=Rhynchophorus ferrugineus TaxID=354439 RepID=UPI003FCEDEDC